MQQMHRVAGEIIHSQLSFPSGHTTAAFLGFGLISCLSKNLFLGVGCAFLAGLVAYSRMYLGQHYLKDVVAGESVALLLLAVFIYFSPKLMQKIKFRK
jgi:membrane-associated phospholipid phosphatase